ncbi:MAG: NAD(P)-dependent oxidoreductase [Vicinamibacterales bacterium]
MSPTTRTISAEVAAALGIELKSLDEICATADYLTLHMPSTAETKNSFNDERFAKCKKGIRIINTARGDLIDEAALVRAIESGIVGGAGLDVFQKEPPVDWALPQLAKVVAAPRTSRRRRKKRRNRSVSIRRTPCATI